MFESKQSGRGLDQIYEPTLWYYNLLQFTIYQETLSNSLCNIDLESCNEDTHFEQNNDDNVCIFKLL